MSPKKTTLKLFAALLFTIGADAAAAVVTYDYLGTDPAVVSGNSGRLAIVDGGSFQGRAGQVTFNFYPAVADACTLTNISVGISLPKFSIEAHGLAMATQLTLQRLATMGFEARGIYGVQSLAGLGISKMLTPDVLTHIEFSFAPISGAIYNKGGETFPVFRADSISIGASPNEAFASVFNIPANTAYAFGINLRTDPGLVGDGQSSLFRVVSSDINSGGAQGVLVGYDFNAGITGYQTVENFNPGHDSFADRTVLATTVPKPGSSVLMLAGAACCCRRRRK